VDIPKALFNQLAQFANSVGLDAEILHLPLTNLVADLRVVIPSYRGLQVTILFSDQPVTLTELIPQQTDGAVTTSLRVPLSLLGPGHDEGSRIIFYASTPGAFVDLAADLGYVLKAAVRTDHLDGHGAASDAATSAELPISLVLDGDLSPDLADSGLTGLPELSSINRALGILIDRGHNAGDAYDILRLEATAAGVATHVFAARMLMR
jgi:hypothetical protein